MQPTCEVILTVFQLPQKLNINIKINTFEGYVELFRIK